MQNYQNTSKIVPPFVETEYTNVKVAVTFYTPCGSKNRTCDIRLMRPMNYHCSIPQYGRDEEIRTPNAFALGPKPSPYTNSGTSPYRGSFSPTKPTNLRVSSRFLNSAYLRRLSSGMALFILPMNLRSPFITRYFSTPLSALGRAVGFEPTTPRAHTSYSSN